MVRPAECPICRKTVVTPAEGNSGSFPFCSERCRQVDLLRWSKGQYAIVEPLSPEFLLESSGEDADSPSGT